jgi:hypothetical protein
MKIVTNQTAGPLRVPLPQGKTLHLGPRQQGEINAAAVDHPPLQKLIEEGKLKVEGEGRPAQSKPGGRQSGKHVETHGFAPPGAGGSMRGDR